MKIYLSSTLEDLREHRASVMDALRKEEHVVVDSYEATPQPTLAQCIADLEKCEVFVGVIAWRYGWEPPGQTGPPRSITELEYRAAAAKKRLMFTRPMKGWDADRVEYQKMPAIEAFRRHVTNGTNETSNEFDDPRDLALKVARAVRNLERADAEAERRARTEGRGGSLMEAAPPPHPHGLATGLLLLGARGTDDVPLQRLRDALPAEWRPVAIAWDAEADRDLPAIDARAARSRAAALLVTPASLPRLQKPAAAEVLRCVGARLGGFFVLSAGVEPGNLPAAWRARRVLPIGDWLASAAGALGGQLADLYRILRADEADLDDDALVGLACTVIAMTRGEAEALEADATVIRDRLGAAAHDYFTAVTTRLSTLAGEPWTARYGAARDDWRPFGTRSAAELLDQAVARLNGQAPGGRDEGAALHGKRVRLRPYPFDPARLEPDTPVAAAYEAMRNRGGLVLIDELSMLHPALRPTAAWFVSDPNVSVATLSPLDPSASALDTLTSPVGPFNIGALVDRFGTKLDPRCELSINSIARLRRWLRLAIPETLATTSAQAAAPDRRDEFRKIAFRP